MPLRHWVLDPHVSMQHTVLISKGQIFHEEWAILTPKMKKIRCPETSGYDYLVAKRHVPEERYRWFALILSSPPNTLSATCIKKQHPKFHTLMHKIRTGWT